MYIGIDIGTSGVKLLLVSSTGEVIKSSSKSYDLLIPKPMWTEQDPNIWFQQVLEGLKEIVSGHESHIKAISFSGQMHGLVLLDKNNQVLRNAILWNDQRTTKENEYLNQEVGISSLLNYTGNISLTGLTAPKILWVKNNERELFDKIHKIMLPKDYIAFMLSGVFATDVSDVSGTLYYDVANKCYSEDMLKILSITKEQLPKVYESFESIGYLKDEMRTLLNIPNPISVIIGGGDQAVGAVGVGIVDSGSCSISLGTSGVVFVASENFKVDHQSYLQSYAHCNGKFHLMGVMLNAAGSLNWWSERIFKNYNYSDFFEKLEKIPIEDSLYFLPYLTGERSPINDPDATGVFIGMRIDHRKEHMDRAVIEGVTFALKQTFELINALGVEIKNVRITGGGAKSKFWGQLIADIMDVLVSTIEIEEGPAFGAAILAMVGDGLYTDVKTACSILVQEKETYIPVENNVVLYSSKYESFKKIYPALKELYKSL